MPPSGFLFPVRIPHNVPLCKQKKEAAASVTGSGSFIREPRSVHIRSQKGLAEFASADANHFNHFSDDMCVRKILLGRQCTQRVRAADRISLGNEIEDFMPV